MKYEIGDFVSKPVTGVCKIEDIVSLNLTGKKENKLYYPMRRKTPCCSYGDIRRVHRIYASN